MECGKLPYLVIPSKTATLVPEFAVEDLLWTELQSWFLRLQWKNCFWAEHSDDDDDFQDLEYTVEKSKILTINMDITKFNKTQS